MYNLVISAIMKTDFIRKLFLVNTGLVIIEGLFVFWQYIQTPSEAETAVLLGFSPLRLAILAGVLLILAAMVFLFASSMRAAWWQQTPGKYAGQLFERGQVFWWLILALTVLYVLIFSVDSYLGFIANYRGRLFPILVWFGLIALQWLLSWLYVQTMRTKFFERFRSLLIPAGIALLLLLTVIAFISLTRIGLIPDTVYWQEAGVPLLFSQILLVLACGAVLHGLFTRFNIPDGQKADLVILLVLWAISFAAWGGTAATPAYNMLEPAPPNFQGYPFGDAMLYDVTAQNFLIGKPIPADFWAKPLYSFFLSILHLIAGQDFARVSLLQTAFLAFIPAVFYLLTRILGGRLAGIVAALLLMVREWNAIRLSNVIQVSHVKLLLSDVFAMGGLILITWLLLRWLEKPTQRNAAPVAVGGAIGLLILVRGHPVLLVPFLFAMAFFFLRGRGPSLRDGLIKMTIGLVLVMLPWFWHTYNLTGRFAFQDSRSSFAHMDAFVQEYADSSGDPASYGQFEQQIFRLALTEPLEVTRFISSHYTHNAIFSYLFLPQSFQVESLRSYVKRLPFWGNWNGELSTEARILMLIHLSVLALGLGAAWRKTKGLVFVPLILGAAYNLSVAVSRRSGWRFIQPADWVTLVFYAIGIVQIILIVYSIVKKSNQELDDQRLDAKAFAVPGLSGRSYALAGLPFLLIVMSLALGHKALPSAYPVRETSALVQMYENASQGIPALDATQIEQFLQQDDAVILYGKALYPIYFKKNVGALNYSWLSFAPKPYHRLAMYVIGPEPAGVIFPTASRPSTLPDGSDVIVLGCKTELGDIDALSIAITSLESPLIYLREPLPPLTCPLAESQ